jgi:antitoxin MazE
MSLSLKLKVVRIGNSQGIRLPKPLLAECGIQQEVEVEVIDGTLVLRPTKNKAPRQGWAKAFSEMSKCGDDSLLMSENPSQFDESDWQWK